MEPAKIRRNYINGTSGQIHLRLAGSGRTKRPLVCFHLSPLSGSIYEAWLGEMGTDRFVVAPDTPGYGMSDPPKTPPTIRDYALEMEDLLDALDVAEADLMGYHTGSKIAVELARLRPRRVKHVVLVSAPVPTPEELAAQRAASSNLNSGAADDGSHLTAQWQMLWRARGPEQTADMIMRHFPDALRGGPRRAWGPAASMAYQFPDHIGEVTAPILVLNTNDDLATFTPRILPYLKNGRLLDLPAWGHGFLDLHAADAAEIVRPFLDDDRWPAEARAP